MYNLFCSNYKNFKIINEPSCRTAIVQVFDGLTDFETYNNWKQSNDPRYYEVCNLVNEIGKANHYAFETLFFELKMNGYNAISSNTCDKEILGEQIKLIALLLTTHYWIDS